MDEEFPFIVTQKKKHLVERWVKKQEEKEVRSHDAGWHGRTAPRKTIPMAQISKHVQCVRLTTTWVEEEPRANEMHTRSKGSVVSLRVTFNLISMSSKASHAAAALNGIMSDAEGWNRLMQV